MAGVEESDAEGSNAKGSEVKAIQDADSSGTVDLTATLPSGVVLSGVKGGVAKTDERTAKTDEPGLEPSDPRRSDPRRSDLRRPCNFEEDGDEPNLQDEWHEVHRNSEEEMAWQHYLDNITEDQVLKDAADKAIEGAKARSVAINVETPEFIKAVKKGKGQTAT